MKTIVLSMFATLLFVCSGFAQKSATGTLKLTTPKGTKEYRYATLADFDKGSETVINDTGKVIAGDPVPDGTICMTTISMTVSVTTGTGAFPGGAVTVTVSGSITVPCVEFVAASKRLRAQLLAAANSQ